MFCNDVLSPQSGCHGASPSGKYAHKCFVDTHNKINMEDACGESPIVSLVGVLPCFLILSAHHASKCNQERCYGFLRRFWVSRRRLGCLLEGSWGLLEESWGGLGGSWDALGGSWRHLEQSNFRSIFWWMLVVQMIPKGRHFGSQNGANIAPQTGRKSRRFLRCPKSSSKTVLERFWINFRGFWVPSWGHKKAFSYGEKSKREQTSWFWSGVDKLWKRTCDRTRHDLGAQKLPKGRPSRTQERPKTRPKRHQKFTPFWMDFGSILAKSPEEVWRRSGGVPADVWRLSGGMRAPRLIWQIGKYANMVVI